MNAIVHNIGHKAKLSLQKIGFAFMRIEGKINRKKNKRKKGSNKTFVFVANYPQGWNSYKKVFEILKSIKGINVILLGYVNDRYPSSTVDFWKQIDSDAVIATNHDIPSLRSLSADVIFRQTPYDDEYPNKYSAREISKVGKLCYIPYGYQMSSGVHLQSEFNDWFLSYLSAVYACNEPSYRFCAEKTNRWRTTRDIHVFDYGYPRFDLLRETSRREDIHRFLWIPRWSVDDIKNNGTSFFDYCNLLIEFFDCRKGLSLLIRPHPLMFGNFVKQKLMTEIEIDTLKRKIDQMPNVFLDENEDYLESFNCTDAMIADYSTLIVEYFVSGKPIIYCGDTQGVNCEMSKMIELMYYADSWEQLSNFITELSKGNDPDYVKRQSFITDFFHIQGNCISERIVESCLNEI